VARIRIYLSGQIIVSFGGSPIAVLLVSELGLAVAGEVAELNQRLVAGSQDLVLQGGIDAPACGGAGS